MSKKKLAAIVLMITGVCIIVAFGLITYLNSRKPTAGLKVETNVDSLVFVDNQQIGQAPVDKMFRAGEVTVKIIPSTTSNTLTTFQTKVKLESKVYTVIKQEFGTTDADSAGEIISLVPQSGKTASLSIVTTSPDTASVTVDGQPQGFTPLIVPSLPAGSHQVIVSAPGYTSRTIAAQTVAGYKLVLSAKLAGATETTPTPTPDPMATPSATPVSGTPAPTTKVTPTPKITPTPTPKATPSPTPAKTSTAPSPTKAATASATPAAIAKPYVTIGDTPTGFLRVRSGPSTGSSEVGQVKPGETYPLLNSATAGWYQIKVTLPATSSGWISSQYATKTE